jgi:hypothetical protein
MAKPGRRPWVLRQFSLLRTSIALRLFVAGVLLYVCLPPLITMDTWGFPPIVISPVILAYVVLPSLVIAIALWTDAYWASTARFIQNALTPIPGLFVASWLAKHGAGGRGVMIVSAVLILPFLLDEIVLAIAWVVRTVKEA